jgi:hypothetical protein
LRAGAGILSVKPPLIGVQFRIPWLVKKHQLKIAMNTRIVINNQYPLTLTILRICTGRRL